MLSENVSPVSSFAFESYVINVLREYLLSQNKTLLEESYVAFDAVLPQGINEIDGPVYLNIMTGYTTKSRYFSRVAQLPFPLNETDPGTILLILGTPFTDKSKQSMVQLAESRSKRRSYVWDIDDFNKLTKDFNAKYKEFLDSPTVAFVDNAINNPSNKRETTTARQGLISALKREYDREELALFLGAGISKDAGIPQWNELINALLSKMIISRIKDDDSKFLSKYLDDIIELAHQNQENTPITQMRYIKGAFTSDEYNSLVHEVLYRKKPKTNTALLKAITNVCTPKRNHIGVQGVITYNFDDLLERCLQNAKIQTNILTGEEDISTPDKLSIYHVHGYMPLHISEESPNTDLIFSEEDYHKVYRDAYCWSNLAQLNYLREHTCLFIGCSLTDPNLRRLLDVARRSNEKPRHFAFLRRNSVVNNGQVDQRALEFYKDIDSSLREKYYAALGLNIIWVDDYSEIPQILSSIL